MHCKQSILILLLSTFSLSAVSAAEVKVTVDRNDSDSASHEFKFKSVPSPVKENAASKAKLKIVVGAKDGNSADIAALTDGVLPTEQDQPEANFFFEAGSDGGRFLIDLGEIIDVAQVNSYSWHPNTRGPQVYALFVSDGKDPKFNPQPDAKTDPTTCGWKRIASVDTRPKQGDGGGQYGVSITDSSGSLGKFRYLLFDTVPTESDDAWGNTFFSEINVIAKK
jgi:hypothetical protein